MINLFHENFFKRAKTDFDILDEGGRVLAKVKYVCGISESLVSAHVYDNTTHERAHLTNVDARIAVVQRT